METLTALLDSACARHASDTALERGPDALSYGEWQEQSGSIARALREAGVLPDEPVLVAVSNRPVDLAAFFGTWQAGAVVVPVHRDTPPTVRAALAARTRARLLLDGASLSIVSDAVPPRRELLAGAALIVFTSGSTGLPKGVVLSHAALAGKLAAIDRLLQFGARERTLLVLNITFSFGIWVSLLTLARGGTLRMAEKFDPGALLAELREGRIRRVAVVPTMMRAWFAGSPPAADVPDLRQVLIGGEPLGAALSRRIRAALPGAGLYDIFGLTETATSDFFLMPDEHDRHPGCIGRPSPGVEYRIALPDGSPAAAAIQGELQIRTPYAMSGYLDEPALTAAAYDDGYFRTGDLALAHPGGVVQLVGRAKEIVSRGGNKIAPLEVEAAFAALPGVSAVLATGVPDPVLGERLHLLVVPSSGATIDAETLRSTAAERLEKFKRPDRYWLADALPLGRTGKADRGELRRLIESGACTPVPGQ